MPVNEYYAADSVSYFNKLVVQAALTSPGVIPTEVRGYRAPDTVEVFLPEGTVDSLSNYLPQQNN